MRIPAQRLAAWASAGIPVIVEYPDIAWWARLRAQAPVEILDAGLTTVPPGTCTALARWA